MKVYLDIITNHTADVIKYRECPANDCAYRTPRRVSAFARAAASAARRSTPGFAGDRQAGPAARQFRPADPARLRLHAATCPTAEANVKVPAWLNDPIYYHNRGDSTFERRELDDGRLLRPRRSVHRASARGRRLHRDLRPVDRRFRDRRLPHRHRQARQSGILAGLRAGHAGAGEGARHSQLPHLRRGLRSRSRACWRASPGSTAIRPCSISPSSRR